MTPPPPLWRVTASPALAPAPPLRSLQGLKGAVNLETGTVNNWIGVLAILLALAMNMSAIDSIQVCDVCGGLCCASQLQLQLPDSVFIAGPNQAFGQRLACSLARSLTLPLTHLHTCTPGSPPPPPPPLPPPSP